MSGVWIRRPACKRRPSRRGDLLLWLSSYWKVAGDVGASHDFLFAESCSLEPKFSEMLANAIWCFLIFYPARLIGCTLILSIL